ncbi:MAG: GNAT family N-acetyltransferase [Actinocatenispora sp.]
MPMTQPGAGLVRRATPDDAAVLVALRAQMMADMGRTTDDTEWRVAAERWFAEHLRPTSTEAAAFVVDDPELGVVACALGLCDRHVPSPGNVSGLRGHVSSVSTDPRRRRRGHARACLTALLRWFREETGAPMVTLTATETGIELYRSLGFVEHRYPSLRLRMAGAAQPPVGAETG